MKAASGLHWMDNCDTANLSPNSSADVFCSVLKTVHYALCLFGLVLLSIHTVTLFTDLWEMKILSIQN